MMEKIEKTLEILAEYGAPDDIAEEFRELRKQARYQAWKDFTADAVMILQVPVVKKQEWAIKALEVWQGKMPKYDPAEINLTPCLMLLVK